MPHDYASGLVYSETIVRPTQGKNTTIYKTRGRIPRYTFPSKGAYTLTYIATRHLLCNLDGLTLGALQALPSLFLDMLWTTITKANLDSVAVWQLFVQAGAFDHFSTRRYADSSLPLSTALKVAHSASLSWLTNLTLRECHTHDPNDLYDASQLSNLRSVHFQARLENDEHFLDRLLRVWSRSAKCEKAFTRLEMIFVDQTIKVSWSSMKHFNNFPALDTFVLRSPEHRSMFTTHCPAHGWLANDDAPFLRYLEQNMRYEEVLGRDQHLVQLSWSDQVSGYICHRNHQVSEKADDTPVLNVRLGAQRNMSLITERAQGEVVCLERDWDICPMDNSLRDLPERPEDQVKSNSASKRRKLRDGKSLAMNTMFNDV